MGFPRGPIVLPSASAPGFIPVCLISADHGLESSALKVHAFFCHILPFSMALFQGLLVLTCEACDGHPHISCACAPTEELLAELETRSLDPWDSLGILASWGLTSGGLSSGGLASGSIGASRNRQGHKRTWSEGART